jgi:hypothetical protein
MQVFEDIEHLGIAENLHAGLHELGAHAHRQETADDAPDHGQDQVHRPDVLVVGREEPTPDPRWMVVVMDVFGMGGMCHGCLSYVVSVIG